VSRRRLQLVLALGLLGALAAVGVAVAGGGGTEFKEHLTGYQEVPAVSTDADGTFEARISPSGDRIDFTLSYSELTGAVQQAHIHFGQRSVNGGISAFLCTNLGNGSPGTPACPPDPATVTGTITAEDVVGPANQGIAPGEFDELVDAIKDGWTYANVHSSLAPAGEIRGQLNDDRDDDD
jgi:CHRD domain